MFFGLLLVFLSVIIGSHLGPVPGRLRQPIIAGFSGLVGRFYPQNTVRGLSLRLKRAGMETTSTEFFLGVKGFAAIVGGVLVSGLVNAITADPLFTLGGLIA